MKLHRIFGITLRYLYLLKHSYDRLNDMFYWPLLDLILWGLTTTYFKLLNPNISDVVFAIIWGILFWLIVNRGQFEISIGLLEDLWNDNLINFFVAPILFWEWLLSLIILGILKATVSFSFAALVAYIFYKIHVFQFGFAIIPFAFLLLMSGWWIGFFMAGLILRFGTKIQTFAWSVPALIAPFSAIYYPSSILPEWAQVVSRALPTTYIFAAMKEVVMHGTLDWNKLYISFVLNVFYLMLSLIFVRTSFTSVLKKGLVHLG